MMRPSFYNKTVVKAMRIPKFLYFFFIGLSLFVIGRGYYWITDDFHIGGISHPVSFHEEERTEDVSALEKVFNQPYSYLGKGAQCYAFASEDGEYIVKFFKFKHLRPRWYMRCLPNWEFLKGIKSADSARKEQKLHQLFSGYALAAKEHPDHAGIVYLHLNPTTHLQKKLVVHDKMGWLKKIDLDSTPFVVQKRGKILRQVLREALDEGDTLRAKGFLRDIMKMYLDEYHSGMYDRDHGVMHNTGFIGDHPFHLDLGKFCCREEMQEQEHFIPDLSFVLWKIDRWLQDNYPTHQGELSQFMGYVFSEETGCLLDLAAVDPIEFQRKK